MQRTERFGVLALILLVVTLVTVGLWGEDPTEVLAEARPAARHDVRGQRPGSRDARPAAVRTGLPTDRELAQAAQRSRPPRVQARTRSEVLPVTPEELEREREAREAERMRLSPPPAPQRAATSVRTQDRRSSGQPAQVAASEPRQDPVQPPAGTRVASQPEQERAPRTGQHTVQEGEILGRIALKHGCTVEALCAANPGLQPNRIRVGQRLTLPASSQAIEPPSRTASEARERSGEERGPEGTRSYQVRPGDRLLDLLPAGATLDEVCRLNPGLDPNLIRVGQTLRLPAGSAPSRRTPMPLQQYRVRPGDALERVARRHNCTVEEILALNEGLDPNRIRVDQVLRMPADAGLSVANAR